MSSRYRITPIYTRICPFVSAQGKRGYNRPCFFECHSFGGFPDGSNVPICRRRPL